MFDNVRRVSRQLIAYGTADVSVLAINFFLLPIYTRVLSPTEYGALTLLLVFEAFLKPVLRCGLDGAYLRQYFDETSDAGRRSLAATILAFVVVSNGAALAVLWPAAPWMTRLLLGTGDYVAALWLVAVNSALANLMFLPTGLFRAQERSSLVGTISLLRSVATIVARLILVVGFRKGVYGLALADVVVTLIVVAALSPTLWRMVSGGTWSRSRLGVALRFGSPQVPAGVFGQTMAMTDRYVLGLYLSLQDVGVYSIGITMASILKLFPVAFASAWMPFAFSSLGRADAPVMFARQASYACAVMCFAAVGAAVCAGPVVELVLPHAYHQATAVIPVLVLGITIQATASFMNTSLNVSRRTSRIPLAAAIGALGSLLGSLVLIPRFGVMGAAYGVLCGQVTFAASTAWLAQLSYPIPYETGRLAKAAITALALVGLACALRTGSPSVNLLTAILLVVSYPILLWTWRFLSPSEMASVRQAVRLVILRLGRSRQTHR
jgi:O-antigen/teichoic acid export membrane protein